MRGEERRGGERGEVRTEVCTGPTNGDTDQSAWESNAALLPSLDSSSHIPPPFHPIITPVSHERTCHIAAADSL